MNQSGIPDKIVEQARQLLWQEGDVYDQLVADILPSWRRLQQAAVKAELEVIIIKKTNASMAAIHSAMERMHMARIEADTVNHLLLHLRGKAVKSE